MGRGREERQSWAVLGRNVTAGGCRGQAWTSLGAGRRRKAKVEKGQARRRPGWDAEIVKEGAREGGQGGGLSRHVIAKYREGRNRGGTGTDMR